MPVSARSYRRLLCYRTYEAIQPLPLIANSLVGLLCARYEWTEPYGEHVVPWRGQHYHKRWFTVAGADNDPLRFNQKCSAP